MACGVESAVMNKWFEDSEGSITENEMSTWSTPGALLRLVSNLPIKIIIGAHRYSLS